MKRSLAATLLCFACMAVTAQVKIGIKGGMSYTGGKAVYNGVGQSVSYTPDFGLGAMAKVPFDGALHFSPSVMISKRGFSINNPAGSANKKEQYGITYLDLVPALSTDFEKGNNAFSIGLGPVFGFTNFGKLKITDSAGVKGTQNLKFGYGAYGWFDLGLNASIGARFSKFMVEAVYYHGLANINNLEEFDGRNMQHRSFSLNIGYYFKEAGN